MKITPAPSPRTNSNLARLAALFALTAAGASQAQLIGPDSTLQGNTLNIRGMGCPSGQTWINGGCGVAGGSSSPSPTPAPTPAPAPVSAACLSATPISQTVTGNIAGGSVWGSNNSSGYTTDSSLAKAAVHAGVLANGQSGFVIIQALDTQTGFTGTTANGVTTTDYGGSWCGMRLGSGGGSSPAPAPTPAPAPAACGSQTVSWTQYQGAWLGNQNLAGTYSCSGTAGAASHGGSVSVTNTLGNRVGSAALTCQSGSWSLSSGTCDGATTAVSNWQYFTSSDTNTNYVLQNCWYRPNYVARGMNSYELDYYWRRTNNVNGPGTAVPVSQVCADIYASAEAQTVRVNGGTIAASSESNICGSPNYGYPWTLSSQGQTCKARP